MATLIEHVIKLTDHRDRDLLELTLSKALIDLLPIQRLVIARVISQDGEQRWLEVARLDAKGGGRVLDPARIDFPALPRLDDAPDRHRCMQQRQRQEVAWAGPDGPRINMLPLFSDARVEDAGVIEIHSEAALAPEVLQLIDQLCRIYRNMYTVLEYSDRDALTGMLNRKSLDDAFYSAVLEELDGQLAAEGRVGATAAERRHRVPANYWLGAARIDQYEAILLQHGLQVAEETVQRVARVARNTFRTYDRLYHFASGHFGVLMHCPDEALVLSAFERFRVGVEQANFGGIGRVTLSCGFTTVHADDTPGSALDKTEKALSFAQRSGHNRVCSYPGLERRGFFSATAPDAA